MVNNKNKFEEYKQNWRMVNGFDSIFPAWIMNKDIKIFNYSNVPDYCVEPVKEGISELVHELNMNFKIKDSYINNSVETDVNNLRCRNLKSHLYSVNELHMNKNLKGNPYASVIIIDQKAPHNYDWGFGNSEYGLIFMYLPKERQGAKDFIKKIAKHEAVHLLGLGYHHKEVIRDSRMLAKAYGVTDSCVFNYIPDTLKLCNMCKDALLYRWKRIEEKIGIKCFKN